ncbi:response regulator [Thioflexithrix psekupsensis]|uniref:DNA-binding response regulator n=1 Tax=Thioflexithrix psekupsensis TaxID=1570016 RepID=A0A251X6K3_9GAMM|nr:response regulator [Thioflexithrix psekupsensis]OUD13268.1 hypothetical protein TPSD3_11600 [Thioflexithrix psekupsensis]
MTTNNDKYILVIDDDLSLIELLKNYLSDKGFKVDGISDSDELDPYLLHHRVDLILLDLMLVDDDGLTILRRLREKGVYYPVIMMSANGHTVERVVGLEVGADDYLLKPVDLRELLARIRAVLRRCELHHPDMKSGLHYQFGDYFLNNDTRKLLRGKKEIPLTNIEYNLLLTLVQSPNRVQSRDDLLAVLKYGQETLSRSIDVHIRHLRCKIEPDPSKPIYICTSRGKGYIFYNNPNAHIEEDQSTD